MNYSTDFKSIRNSRIAAGSFLNRISSKSQSGNVAEIPGNVPPKFAEIILRPGGTRERVG